MRVWHSVGAAPLFGLLAGGALGFAAGSNEEDDPNDWDHLIYRFDKGTKMVIDIALGMLAGAGIGYLIGGGNGWRDVDLQKAKLSIVPQFSGGPGVSLAVQF
jgi:hypothetical protein